MKETVTILHRLKRLSKVNGFVSIGDTGKLVRELKENKFVSGHVWIVHDDLGLWQNHFKDILKTLCSVQLICKAYLFSGHWFNLSLGLHKDNRFLKI